ncbi:MULTISPECIES: hypothetical protein [unclassified Paraburkholderia]|uniref:hypothetical protein n=1 Tax=unclassified Paraburkholderia TaxID=2615204 RepID=UPI0020B6CBD2|nr:MULTISPECIES: hypothetical protein [unclassified Paraburkholderia]MCP3720769.1 hypothetical protein [Paraburkholderia sp. CNPSo 3281]MCX5543531.1 hypothetical protein [Paraburkholderia sp. CNPSo 3076]
MIESQSTVFVGEDKFAVAQVALYILAVLQVVAAVMLAIGGASIPFPQQATSIQRFSGTVNAVVMVLAFAAVYYLLARCLYRCTKLVWRIAVGAFLTNLGMTVLTMVAQPGPSPVVTGCLCFAGIVSLWRGRNAVSG